MKRLMMTTALIAMAATAGHAQTGTTTPMNDETFLSGPGIESFRASDFIGMRVYSMEEPSDAVSYDGIQDNWEDIGEINDVVLSRDGRIDAVLVDIGGFLGIGERQIAVNMDSLRFVADDATPEDVNDFFLVMTANRGQFEEAPEYDWSQQGMAEETAMERDTDAAVTPGTTATDTDMTENADAEAAEVEYVEVEAASVGVEEMTGAPVYDAAENWIGEVSELVINTDNQIDGAVVDVGGFLGIGEKPVMLALDELMFEREADGTAIRVHVNMTKEELEAMPDYEG